MLRHNSFHSRKEKLNPSHETVLFNFVFKYPCIIKKNVKLLVFRNETNILEEEDLPQELLAPLSEEFK
jgi:hypothetical protein